MSSEFRYRRIVQFAETDLAGIVHFSTLFRYMEEAEHAMWRSVGLTIAERGGTLGWPRLGAAMEFRNPLRFEDEVEVVVRVAHLKRRTIDYEFVLRTGATLVAMGTISCICTRKQADGSMRATEIPEDVSAKLRAFLAA
jgi:YbgC/YbaW family acyl-CoA thioester hydrolase